MSSLTKILSAILFLGILAQTNLSLADCIDSRSLVRFDVINYRTLEVETTFRDIFQLETVGCLHMNQGKKFKFDMPMICEGDDLIVLDAMGEAQSRCEIVRIKQVN